MNVAHFTVWLKDARSPTTFRIEARRSRCGAILTFSSRTTAGWPRPTRRGDALMSAPSYINLRFYGICHDIDFYDEQNSIAFCHADPLVDRSFSFGVHRSRRRGR